MVSTINPLKENNIEYILHSRLHFFRNDLAYKTLLCFMSHKFYKHLLI